MCDYPPSSCYCCEVYIAFYSMDIICFSKLIPVFPRGYFCIFDQGVGGCNIATD